MGKIKVLVVDDSAFMRKIIPEMLHEDKEIEVVGVAKDGNEALKKALELKPDVITMDVEMPQLGGLETLGYIMSEIPTPVIMLSAYTPHGAEITLQALEYGAVDFVCKPSGEISIDIKKVQKELLEKIKAAKNIDLTKMNFILPDALTAVVKSEEKKELKGDILVIIAASTGGPRALVDVIPKIPRGLPAIFLVIQHMSSGFTKTLAERINTQSKVEVKEAEHGEILKAGRVYFAPGNFHMEVIKTGEDYFVDLNQKPVRLGVRPSADMAMFSAAKAFDGKMIGVILTGMGRDGTAGAEKLKEKKAFIISQDKETSVIYGMPKAVAEKGIVDKVAPITSITDEIVSQINKWIGK